MCRLLLALASTGALASAQSNHIRDIHGTGLSQGLGGAVAVVDDLDGDGYDEIAGRFHGLPPFGVYAMNVYSGSTGEPLASFGFEAGDDYYPWTFTSFRDWDGDSVRELAIGDPYYGVNTGSVHIVSPKTRRVLATLRGEPSSSFGQALCTRGDLDGDGIRDLIVTGTGAGDGAYRVWVFSGKDLTLLHRLETTGSERIGTAVASGVDVDLDGCDELIVNHSAYVGNSRRTTVRVYSGRTGARLYALTGLTEDYGTSIAPIGRIDGDAVVDFAVGTPSRRTVELVSGATGQLIYSITRTGLGGMIVETGDVSGDGIPDMLLNEHSETIVVSGINGMTLLRSPGGQAIACGGDYNRDGAPDYLVGSEIGLGQIQVYSTRRLLLSQTTYTASTSQGIDNSLFVDAGAPHGGDAYWLLGSVSGTSPGIQLGNHPVGLNPDGYFWTTVAGPAAVPWWGFSGTLDQDGRALAGMRYNGRLPYQLAGLTLHHVALVFDSGGALARVSPPIGMRLRN